MIHTRYECITITLLNNVTYCVCDTNREFNDLTIFNMHKNRDYHDANHEFNDITMFSVDGIARIRHQRNEGFQPAHLVRYGSC